jgi:hypothetical protein
VGTYWTVAGVKGGVMMGASVKLGGTWGSGDCRIGPDARRSPIPIQDFLDV